MRDDPFPYDDYEDPAPILTAIVACLLVAVTAMAIYALTAGRSIAWWESAEYVVAAATLGVAHPPGSLLLTILGWLAIKIPYAATTILKLNLFAGLVAALTSGLLAALALRLLGWVEMSRRLIPRVGSYVLAAIGAGLGTLIFAFAHTAWLQATKFTPYGLTALFTILITWALLLWWRRAATANAAGWLFVIALLFGLDFSVHRTNFLLVPGVLVWILLRRPRVLSSLRAWMSGVIGLVVGLSLHLLLIPMAARQPFLNATDPNSLSRLYDYVSLKMAGGSWLINLYPRKGPFWSWQVMDYLHGFAANFAPVTDKLGFLGILPLLLGLLGIVMMWRRNWKLTTGLLILFLSASVGAIIYFNVPDNYFRAMDRHYLPSFLIFGVWIAYGCGWLLLAMRKLGSVYSAGLTPVVSLLLIWAVGNQVQRNWDVADRSNRFFAEDFAGNLLATLPHDAIIFTAGDNDTFPIWYLQAVEGRRRDVTLLNINLANTSWFLENLMEREPDFPLSFTHEEFENLRPISWQDTTIAIAAPSMVSSDTPADDSLRFEIGPTMSTILLPQDQVLINILQTNHWRRPIYFAATLPSYCTRWVQPYLRTEGLAQRLVPVAGEEIDAGILRENLMKRYSYRGYADKSVFIEPETMNFGRNYYSLSLQLAQMEARSGESSACEETRNWLGMTLPASRIDMPAEALKLIDCRSGLNRPEGADSVAVDQDSLSGQ